MAIKKRRKQKMSLARRSQLRTKTKSTRHGNTWTEEEIGYVRQLGSARTMEEVAILVNRTYYAIGAARRRFVN